MQQMTQDARISLDWKALQKALVFTKLVYRKPAVKRSRRSARRDLDVIAQRTANVLPAPVVVVSPFRHVDALGETDERLLPWSRD
jgi:hypothetical protein